MNIPVQKKYIFFMTALVFLWMIPFTLAGGELFCRICHGRISGRYFTVNKKPCCSRNCAEEMRRRLLPECYACRRSMERFVKITSHNEERSYCLSCNGRPKCFHCKFPERSLIRLPDGRRLCRICSHSAVTDRGQAAELFSRTRRNMGRFLGIETPCRISFSLADTRKIASLHKEGGTKEWGLYVCRKRTKMQIVRSTRTGKIIRRQPLPAEKQCFIYILSHLTRDTFSQTAAHELTHDYMEEHFPCIKDPLWCEGAAEYAAFLYNIVTKNSGRNRTIEKNQDPVYGGGFRMIASRIPSHLSPRQKAEHLIKLLAGKNREEMRKQTIRR